MTQLSSSALIGAQGIFDTSTTQLENIGAKMETSDGRIFRYAQATLLLVTGNLLQNPPVVANHQTLTPSIFALNATSIVATLGATSASANVYANGYAIVNTTPGNGYAYLVSGHAAVASSGSITINLADQVQVAGTAASIIDLVYNPYFNVIQQPTTKTGAAIGVAAAAIPALSFGWVQTHGVCAVLSTGTPVIGSSMSDLVSTAGSAVQGTQSLVIGFNMKTGVDGKNVPTYLVID